MNEAKAPRRRGRRHRGNYSFKKKAVVASTILAAAALAALVLVQVVRVLLMVFAGILVAVFLWQVSRMIAERTRLRPGTSLLLVVAFLFLSAGGIVWLLGPGLVEESERFVEEVPRALEGLKQSVRNLPWGDRLLSMASSTGPDLAGSAAAQVPTAISRAITAVAYAFIVIFVGIYVAYAPETHWNGLMHLVPPEERPRAVEILLDVRDNLWWWVLGRLFSMTLVGLLIGLGLFILGVPSAGVLAILAGLLDFIPNFGPFLAFLPALLITLSEGAEMVVYVALLYAGVQVAESLFITPLVEHRMVSVPPALVIVSQVLAGVLFGALGLLLATPLALTVMVLVKRLYVEDYLGEDADQSVVPA